MINWGDIVHQEYATPVDVEDDVIQEVDRTNAVYTHGGNIEKIDDFKYDKVYFGSPYKISNPMKLDGPLFVSPFPGIASIFSVRPQKDVMKNKYGIPVEKVTNRDYDEWDRNKIDELKKGPIKELHVRLKGITDMKPIEDIVHGYLGEITITDELKEHIYQSAKMHKVFEYCIDHIDSVSFSDIKGVEIKMYITGETPRKTVGESFSLDDVEDDFFIESAFSYDKTMEACQELHKEWSKFGYGIPINGKLTNVSSGEEFCKNYRFLSPEDFEKYNGGVCWDFVEWGAKFLRSKGVTFHQYYIQTDTPPNYDTHTFIVCQCGDKFIYPESAFGIIEKDINGVGTFESLPEIFNYVASKIFECNNNRSRFNEFKFSVQEYTQTPNYGCTCEEYMDFMKEHAHLIFEGIAIADDKHVMESYDDSNDELVDYLNWELEQYIQNPDCDCFILETFSKKEKHRIEKFLKENNFKEEGTTESDRKQGIRRGTIETDIIDEKTGKKKRVPFVLTPHEGYAGADSALDGSNTITMSKKIASRKPEISNFIFKHEEGHVAYYLDNNTGKYTIEMDEIDKILEKLFRELDISDSDLSDHDKNREEFFADKYAKEHSKYKHRKNVINLDQTGCNVNANKALLSLLLKDQKSRRERIERIRKDAGDKATKITEIHFSDMVESKIYETKHHIEFIRGMVLSLMETVRYCEQTLREYKHSLDEYKSSFKKNSDNVKKRNSEIESIVKAYVNDLNNELIDIRKHGIVLSRQARKMYAHRLRDKIDMSTGHLKNDRDFSNKQMKFDQDMITREMSYIKEAETDLAKEKQELKNYEKELDNSLKRLDRLEKITISTDNVRKTEYWKKTYAGIYKHLEYHEQQIDLSAMVRVAALLDKDDQDRLISKYKEINDEYYSESYVQEAKLTTTKRDKLKDSEFGIPEKRTFPLNDKNHVEAAVRMFPHADASDKEALAKRILRKAHEFGMDTSGWDSINKYVVQEGMFANIELVEIPYVTASSGYKPTVADESQINPFALFDKIPINDYTVNRYKSRTDDMAIGLKHLRVNDNVRGFIWLNQQDEVVGYVAVEKQDIGPFIIALELSPKYQGKGLGKALLEFAENYLGGRYLSVSKNNTHAFEMYKICGWVVYDETPYMYFMKKDDN